MATTENVKCEPDFPNEVPLLGQKVRAVYENGTIVEGVVLLRQKNATIAGGTCGFCINLASDHCFYYHANSKRWFDEVSGPCVKIYVIGL